MQAQAEVEAQIRIWVEASVPGSSEASINHVNFKDRRGEVPPEFSPEFSKMSGLSPLSS